MNDYVFTYLITVSVIATVAIIVAWCLWIAANDARRLHEELDSDFFDSRTCVSCHATGFIRHVDYTQAQPIYGERLPCQDCNGTGYIK